MRIEKYVFFSEISLFFFGDFNITPPQRRSSLHSHTHKHKHNHSHTHAWPTEAAEKWFQRSFFSGFANYFLTTCGQQEFFGPARGSRNIRKYFQSVINVFSCLCLYFYAGIMLHRFSMIRFLTCHVRSHCWK